MKPDNRENLDLSNLENEKMDKRKIGFGFWVSIGWMVLVIMAAFLAPILPIPDPDQTGIIGSVLIPMVEICSPEQFGVLEFLSL